MTISVLKFHTPRMISIPFVKSQAFLLSKHQLVGLEVWSASLHLRGRDPFQGPFPSLRWFLENMTENPNWNSNSHVLLGPSTPNMLGDGQAPPLMTEILISWVHKPQRNWVDGHPLLHENNGSLDPSTNGIYISPGFKQKIRPHHLT